MTQKLVTMLHISNKRYRALLPTDPPGEVRIGFTVSCGMCLLCIDFQPGEILPQNDIDGARQRVASVDGGGSDRYVFDALDYVGWNIVDIEETLEAGLHAPPLEQEQRRAYRQAVQPNGGLPHVGLKI